MTELAPAFYGIQFTWEEPRRAKAPRRHLEDDKINLSLFDFFISSENTMTITMKPLLLLIRERAYFSTRTSSLAIMNFSTAPYSKGS